MSHPAKYLRPPDLQQAIQALADEDLTIAAGCTDLFPATDRKSLQGPVLDITAIPALRGIRQDDEGIQIGATTTWHDIATAGLPPSLFGLQLAAREVGALQIQNRGTIAGNLCNASPAADGVPPLLTLDAEVGLCSIRGRRQIPLAQFITGPRQTERHHDELVTHIFIPKSALQGAGSFVKLGARKYLVILHRDGRDTYSGGGWPDLECRDLGRVLRTGRDPTACLGSASDRMQSFGRNYPPCVGCRDIASH